MAEERKNPSFENTGFAYVGRLVIEKRCVRALEAGRRLRAKGRAVGLIIGDGPERPYLEKQIATSQLESCVRITVFLSGEVLQHILGNVGIIVMPTVMEETAGLAALEQMAQGRPVIASSVGGLKEIVEGAGLTFPLNDSPAPAEAMTRMLDEPGLASSLSSLARQRALRSFSFSAMIDAHANVYRALFQSKQAGRSLGEST